MSCSRTTISQTPQHSAGTTKPLGEAHKCRKHKCHRCSTWATGFSAKEQAWLQFSLFPGERRKTFPCGSFSLTSSLHRHLFLLNTTTHTSALYHSALLHLCHHCASLLKKSCCVSSITIISHTHTTYPVRRGSLWLLAAPEVAFSKESLTEISQTLLQQSLLSNDRNRGNGMPK